MKPKIIIILGPTASGKSNLAVKLAKQFNGEIISADSRQIYQEMNIGSNKITKKEMHGVKHHLLDIVKPNQPYTLYNWQQDTLKIIDKLIKDNKLPIIAGGTGLYISSILENYQIPQRRRECPYEALVFGINPDRDKLYDRINKRVEQMAKQGLIEEVTKIYKKYPNKKLVSLSGIGYKEIISYLNKKITLEQAIEQIQQNTRNYAKRQMTWLRRMEKRKVSCI